MCHRVTTALGTTVLTHKAVQCIVDRHQRQMRRVEPAEVEVPAMYTCQQCIRMLCYNSSLHSVKDSRHFKRHIYNMHQRPYPTIRIHIYQHCHSSHHTRSGVQVNTNVNITNTMPVQSGPNGPLAGPGASSSQLQLLAGAVQPGANTVLGVGGTGNGQVGVGVGVPPMVGVMAPNVSQQSVQAPPSSRRRHQHRLQIIDPATRKNILDDLDKVSRLQIANVFYTSTTHP